MAKFVHEIINPDLFFLGPHAFVQVARGCILALHITSTPVLDSDGKPIGMVSLRDLIGDEGGPRVAQRMTSPVEVIRGTATIEEAGRTLAESGRHRLVVVDEDGRAAGVVSAIDVIRGMLGMPIRFAEKLQHRDALTGLMWRGDYRLDSGGIAEAPAAPGVIIVKHCKAGVPDVPVWVGVVKDIRATLREILVQPGKHDQELAGWLMRAPGELEYRIAVIHDDTKRSEALGTMQAASLLRAWARDGAI